MGASARVALSDEDRAAYDEVSRRAAGRPCVSARVFAWIAEPIARIQRREIAWLAALDAGAVLRELRELDRGDRTSVAVCQWAGCGDVAAAACRAGEPYAILAHNHPSGYAAPSDADVELTRVVGQALWRRRVLLLDHVILGHDQLYSFQEGRVIR